MSKNHHSQVVPRWVLAASVGSFIFSLAGGCTKVPPPTESATFAADPSCDPKKRPSSFEDFKKCTYREQASGIWIVDGDIPVVAEADLRRFYDALSSTVESDRDDAFRLGNHAADLVVNQSSGVDTVWSLGQRCALRYCVSTQTAGQRHGQVVNAMRAATQAWANLRGVRFAHASSEDGNCTDSNANVDFDVQVVSGQPYLARAFFPNQDRATRNINIDTTSFSTTTTTLEGILRHELGHAIGFRHEHTRPEAGACFEDNSWRPLTPYDSNSVMHYPQCNGTAGWALNLSQRDREGFAALYSNTLWCFQQQAGTGLHPTDGNFKLLIAPNRDMFAIKKDATGTGTTEVHVLSASSGYSQFALQTGTALHTTDASFDFALAPNRDVFAIKRSATGSGSTEIHVLSASSGYRQFSLQTGTGLHETDANFAFAVGPNRDLFAIKKAATGTGTTEVHVLSAASGYRQFSLQTGTALHETDGSFEFGVAPNRDLFAIKKSGTGTSSTEVHVLSSSSGYRQFSKQNGTALHETDGTWEFGVASARDVFGFKKSQTGTNSTEVHWLRD